MKDDRGEVDLTFLAEQHAKETWALKEQISKQSEDLTVLHGTKQVVAQLSNELVRMKKRAQEAEEVNESHQKLNGELQNRLTEVEEDNKKLSKQIDDYLNKFRNAGL